ncbi:unnamed protein product [Albugo candida]|uniref:Uncharacterized protein n=1 Tax=Albugo candida TaxID=65357 RepID=A0A024FU29_9STRA|nr:unnamed protein product [Albugo candida]|eukprot:CCI10516.1 unnamed protein product [Albugo candida]
MYDRSTWKSFEPRQDSQSEFSGTTKWSTRRTYSVIRRDVILIKEIGIDPAAASINSNQQSPVQMSNGDEGCAGKHRVNKVALK